ncbi:MAG: 23S rRNA (guanosine(2251)-2'-O)-methyltransferase RlmB [Peptoniphilus sp.]|nr:23S rRNA (guanosine(2251)-2'-O)-methyltransferase RlmB [Peptoniphilus sp.]MDD7363189.1 23S rRNA (guanosine(2251)-2'-O)-methyltransferase RlmB [Bacillota bacterium]MDY6044487.1 23S rRNA (guanosine(2251)-2'-O)-methyltransferase RlmB [Peptoniphilus sp.]
MEETLIYGRNPVLNALEKKPDRIYIQKGLSDGSIKKIWAKAKALDIEIRERGKSRLDEMTGGENHQGVVAYISNFAYSSLDDMFHLAEARGEDPLFVILDSIQDPHNLGAIVRTAVAMSAHGVIIPKNRSTEVNGTVYKTSAGAVDRMLIAKVTNINRTIEELKAKNVWVYGAAAEGDALNEADLTGPVAVVIGNEGKGMAKKTKEHVDKLLSIPMPGGFESLNASVAASIFLYEIVRQGHGRKKKI